MPQNRRTSLEMALSEARKIDFPKLRYIVDDLGKDEEALDSFRSDPTSYLKDRMALPDLFHAHLQEEGEVSPEEDPDEDITERVLFSIRIGQSTTWMMGCVICGICFGGAGAN